MDHERFSRGWWAATFADSAQEMRFRRAALRNGRFAGFMALSAISVMLGVVYLLLVTSRLVEPSATGVVAVALLFGAGSVAAVALLQAQRPRSIFRAIVLAVALLTVVVTLLLFSGLAGGAPGVILVFGGVVVIYLSVPAPTLSADIAPALAYSAATLPAYLIADGPAPVDAWFTVAAVITAQMLGPVEAWRRQWDRRIVFAQTEELARLSTVDALTRMANRRVIDRELERAWRAWRVDGVPLAALMIDIDHFKQLNDTYGHRTGDVALQQVAEAIRDVTSRQEGMVCGRYGGEEFLCLLTGDGADRAVTVAETVRRAVRARAIPAGRSTPESPRAVTVSIGVAVARESMTHPHELTDLADRHLYRAKGAGRDRVWVLTGEAGAAR